ncbi:hypothetical protein CCMSSC00406_0006902 [Pleurotus cornucopiae]|uniref:Uncharacterized protein n=1 Tax=Pleurotus cornucopiae TaxID=5321 RepID=A0ACB7IP83_PLECO|nr:hypothetical protein CCMSSC00406_0006902 [Pleurotus cornucopiae]
MPNYTATRFSFKVRTFQVRCFEGVDIVGTVVVQHVTSHALGRKSRPPRRRSFVTTRRANAEIDDGDQIYRDGYGTNEQSFIAETSFVRAPLNSRVVSSQAAPKLKGKGKAKQEDLGHIPLEIQESFILEDLLYVLMGIESTYITFHTDHTVEDNDPLRGIRFADYQTLLSQLEHAFNTSPQFSLQKLWFYIHPTVHTLSLIYQLVLEFCTADDPAADSSSSSSDESSIDPEEEARNEALGLGGAKLKAVLSEIDKKGIGNDGTSISVKGGEVLSIIYDRMRNMSGDPTALSVYGTLLQAAGKPYISMLRVWVTTGRLADPYEELLVKESKFINRGILESDYTDEYWERRYTLRDGSTLNTKRQQAGVPPPRTLGGRLPGGACIPPLLEGWKHKILLAGKYLNVIRECGIEISRNTSQTDVDDVSMEDESFYQFLQDAYAHANQTLLQLLLKDLELIPRLRSLKRYFFLSQSSFLTQLLDLAHSELRKSAKSVSIVKLQSLLDIALGAETQGEDALYREDVKVIMAGSGLYEWLIKVVSVNGSIGPEEGEGGIGGIALDDHKKEKDRDKDEKKPMQAIDALALDYNVKFPLSLVVSRKTILRYQLLFRFLLHLKHLEQALSSMWIEQKTGPWRRPLPEHRDFEQWRLRVFLLRARMLSFVQQIMCFATFEVLEPNWRALEEKLKKVTTVDQLLRDHVDFLDTCLKECMLTSSKLLRAYSKLILTCSTFVLYTSSFTKSANQAIADIEAGDGDRGMAKRWDVLGKFEANFDCWFKVHLDCVQFYASSENVSLLPLVVRLNSIKAQS